MSRRILPGLPYGWNTVQPAAIPYALVNPDDLLRCWRCYCSVFVAWTGGVIRCLDHRCCGSYYLLKYETHLAAEAPGPRLTCPAPGCRRDYRQRFKSNRVRCAVTGVVTRSTETIVGYGVLLSETDRREWFERYLIDEHGRPTWNRAKLGNLVVPEEPTKRKAALKREILRSKKFQDVTVDHRILREVAW